MSEQLATIQFVIADSRVDRRGDLVRGSAFAHLAGRQVRGIRQHQRGSAAIGAGPIQVSSDGERAWVDITLAPTDAAKDYAKELTFLRSRGISYAPSVGAVYNLRNVRLRGRMTAEERATGARRVIDRVEDVHEVSSVDVSALPGHTLELQRADGEAVEFSEVVYYLVRDDGEPEATGGDDGGDAEPPEAPDNAAEAAPDGGEGDGPSSTVAESDKIAMAVELASARDTRNRVGRLLDA